VAWLARGSPESPAAARAATAEVEAFCADTGYPQTWFDAGALAAAELLRRVGHGDIAEMGALLARAVPPVAPAVMLVPGLELTGRVVSSRWPTGGPPDELLGPGRRPGPGSDSGARACQRCGKPLIVDGSRGGRPAKYCSGACRTAAHRALHRTASRPQRSALTRSRQPNRRRSCDASLANLWGWTDGSCRLLCCFLSRLLRPIDRWCSCGQSVRMGVRTAQRTPLRSGMNPSRSATVRLPMLSGLVVHVGV